jgi:hypothetical protein
MIRRLSRKPMHRIVVFVDRGMAEVLEASVPNDICVEAVDLDNARMFDKTYTRTLSRNARKAMRKRLTS